MSLKDFKIVNKLGNPTLILRLGSLFQRLQGPEGAGRQGIRPQEGQDAQSIGQITIKRLE